MIPSPTDIDQWFKDQTVLLTGGTGTLGGCLLYKLAIQLPTKRVFVLCRGSIHQAMTKLENSMPEQTDDILESGRVTFVVGDLTKANAGLKESDLHQVQDQVTVVINAAGNVSLLQDLRESVGENTVPHLALVRLCGTFQRIQRFLHVSSAYVNSFLPGGAVEERVYDIYGDAVDSAQNLKSILNTGKSPFTSSFAVPYNHAKYIAERLLLDASPPFPLLIIRPSNIGPAIRDPSPFYGLHMVIPLHSYVQFVLCNSTQRREELEAELPLENIIDEIPVDLVANTCLLHLAMGTTGMVHSAAKLYQPRCVGDIKRDCLNHTSPELIDDLRRSEISNHPEFLTHFTDMFTKFCRDWKFECTRSDSLREVQGPLTLSLEGHDAAAFLAVRIERVARRLLDTVKRAQASGHSLG
ncbi:male sterility protein-domain-containing protein [Aspergillus taichungensis]|uniref:Fatty acyl-CoA reductase n=1 Tax=Aspergillus taichungensis TaxID=482145 RepID=A0A2J5I7E4_9EURO|nr:male sterility protein-domain-containing protein [Aspergillus taichungensis]